MATLLDILSDALTALGQLGAGRSMSPEQAEQGLRVANRMLGKWSVQRLLLYYVVNRTYNLSATVQDYTVGPTGTIGGVSVRPTLVEGAQLAPPGSAQSNTISIYDKPKWDAIGDRGATCSPLGLPQGVYVEYSYPNIGLHFWPVPNNAAQLTMGVWEPLTKFVTIFDDFTFPEGYEEGFMWNIAVEWAPFFDMPVTQSMSELAADGGNNIKKINAQSRGGALGDNQTLQSPNVGQPQG